MFPKARADYISAIMLGVPTLEEYGILDNPARWCAFIANVGCETGGLTIVRENMNYTAANLLKVWPTRYPPTLVGRAKANNHAKKGAKFIANYNYGFRLGNRGRNTDDGWNFRGALLLQHTGRWMATWLQQITGKPWADDPALFDQVKDSVEPACLVWTSQDLGNLNDWADRGLFRACCNGINRGDPRSAYNPIGWPQRQEWYRKALAIWGDGVEAPVTAQPGLLYNGMLGGRLAIVEHYQQRLHDLGYHQVGIVDGRFGDNTETAVRQFQRINGLKVDGIIGSQTRAVIDSEDALPKPITEERATATIADVTAVLPAAQKAQTGKRFSQLLGGFSILGALKWVADQIETVREVIEPLSSHVSWLADFWWIGGILLAVILADAFGGVVREIWDDFVSGRTSG